MHEKLEAVLDKQLADKFRQLRQECSNELIDNFRGLTYQEVKRYEKKKLEVMSYSIEALLRTLLKSKEDTLAAEEAFRKTQELHRAELLKASEEVDVLIKKWKDLKGALRKRNTENDNRLTATPAGDAPPSSSKPSKSDKGTSLTTLSHGRQVSLSGSPFPSGEAKRRSIVYVAPVRPLVFDESVITDSPSTSHKLQHVPLPSGVEKHVPPPVNAIASSHKQKDDSNIPSSLALPEMPHLQSKTLRRLFEEARERSESKKESSSKKINPFSENEYSLLGHETQSLVTFERLTNAVKMLNEYMSCKKQGANHLSSTALMAVLFPDFNLKECSAIHAVLSASGRLI